MFVRIEHTDKNGGEHSTLIECFSSRVHPPKRDGGEPLTDRIGITCEGMSKTVTHEIIKDNRTRVSLMNHEGLPIEHLGPWRTEPPA